MSSGPSESDADFDARYEAFFNRKDIDGWEVRKAMDDLHAMDLVRTLPYHTSMALCYGLF